jgi:hypothetical protein
VAVLCFYLIRGNIRHLEIEKQQLEDFQMQQQTLLKYYDYKVDSISEINVTLEKEQVRLSRKLDSISARQRIINKEYKNEISIIYNATMNDHSSWFYSRIDSLKRAHISRNE